MHCHEIFKITQEIIPKIYTFQLASHLRTLFNIKHTNKLHLLDTSIKFKWKSV